MTYIHRDKTIETHGYKREGRKFRATMERTSTNKKKKKGMVEKITNSLPEKNNKSFLGNWIGVILG